MIGILKIYFLYYIQDIFHIRWKPRILQLPITSKCNSRCLTCNIWRIPYHKDIDVSELKRVLRHPFLSKVKGVGINGGEPSLHFDLVGVVKVLLTLPRINNIFIISNCLNSEKLFGSLQRIHPLCKKRGVRLHLQISIDGIDDIHDLIRGIPVSFNRSIHVLQKLNSHKGVYVDSFDIGCTISKYNVDYLAQVDDFFSEYNIPIYYHLAVPNKRIHNFDNAPFSVLSDKHATQMAKEFFYTKSGTATSKLEKIRCYLIYLYLAGYTHKRMFLCNYLYRDITIDENLDTFLCATASNKVGNMIEGVPPYRQYNLMVKETKAHCDTCIHYAGIPNLRGLFTYLMYKLRTYKWPIRYKYLIG